MKPFLAMAFAASAGAVLAGGAQAAASAPPRLEPVSPCFAMPAARTKVDDRFDCGHVVVPENGALDGGRAVKLFVRGHPPNKG